MPRKMQRFKSSLLVLMLAVAALAQTASEKPNNDVRRVGARLQCQCGCKDSVATCSMLECSFSKPAKLRIAQMQAVGMSDDQIVQAFVRDYPGDPKENFAPAMRIDSTTYRDLALHRPAYHSSAYDYNLTAQPGGMVEDG